MKRVTKIGVLQEAMGRIKRGGPDFSVSFFASASKIEAWIAESALWLSPCEGALLIHRQDGKLLRVCHVATDQPSLSAALGNLVEERPDQLMVADLVGRPDDVERITRIYQRQGFALHAQLVRMQRSGTWPATTDGASDVELARIRDLPELRAFMERWLDPLSEQIQSVAELREAVTSEGVFVVRDDQGLAGILIHETTGQSTALRYWHVAGHRHGQGLGSRLMHAFLARCTASRRVTLWVIAGNVAAIAKYHHYGFSEDGMIDNIMVRQEEQMTQ